MAVLVAADGSPWEPVGGSAAAAPLASPAVDHPLQSDPTSGESIDSWGTEELEDIDQQADRLDQDDSLDLDFNEPVDPRPLGEVAAMKLGTEERTVVPRPRNGRKSKSPIKSIAGIVVGGLLALPLAAGLLALVGRPLDLGFWPFDGRTIALGSNARIANTPLDLGNQPDTSDWPVPDRFDQSEESTDRQAEPAADEPAADEQSLADSLDAVDVEQESTSLDEPIGDSLSARRPANNNIPLGLDSPLAAPDPLAEADPLMEADPDADLGPLLEADPLLEDDPVADLDPLMETDPLMEADPLLTADPLSEREDADSNGQQPMVADDPETVAAKAAIEDAAVDSPPSLVEPAITDDAPIRMPVPKTASIPPTLDDDPLSLEDDSITAGIDSDSGDVSAASSGAQRASAIDLPQIDLPQIDPPLTELPELPELPSLPTGDDRPARVDPSPVATAAESDAATALKSTPSTPSSPAVEAALAEADRALAEVIGLDPAEDVSQMKRRLAGLFAGVAGVGEIATAADDTFLADLIDRLIEADLIKDLAPAAPNWVRYVKRPNDGILARGDLRRDGDLWFLDWHGPAPVEIRGTVDPTHGGSKVVLLGRIVDAESTAAIQATFIRPLAE